MKIGIWIGLVILLTTCVTAASLTIYDSLGPANSFSPGDKVIYQLQDFRPGTYLSIVTDTLESHSEAYARTSLNGTLFWAFYPQSAGYYTVTANDGQNNATANFTVVGDGVVCGDHKVTGDEQCEFPYTNNNKYCNESTHECLGQKYGSRDQFGNCDGYCNCVQDSFTYTCVSSKCGAQCAKNDIDTQPCGFSDVGECKMGTQHRSCGTDCNWGPWGDCVGAVGPQPEVCDGKDNDCDGLVDEDFDKDHDGFKAAGIGCPGPVDCDDNDPNIYPGNTAAEKYCDGKDNDCDGFIDYAAPPQSNDGSVFIPLSFIAIFSILVLASIAGFFVFPQQRLALIATAIGALAILTPIAFSASQGSGLGVNLDTDPLAPKIWLDSNTRIALNDLAGHATAQQVVKRISNYAFEGEKVQYDLLVYDSQGISKINRVESKLVPRLMGSKPVNADCSVNVRKNCILPNIVNDNESFFDYSDYLAWYTCNLSVDSASSMQGKYAVSFSAQDSDNRVNNKVEQDLWFINPNIALAVDGSIDFGLVEPGKTSYSTSVTIKNDAEKSSDVRFAMFISGTDFKDLTTPGAKCPVDNVLRVSNDNFYCDSADAICYSASYDKYSTANVTSIAGPYSADAEGYMEIPHGNTILSSKQLIGKQSYGPGALYADGNILAPGASAIATFKLNLPAPCSGDFSHGDIFFWGEAI